MPIVVGSYLLSRAVLLASKTVMTANTPLTPRTIDGCIDYKVINSERTLFFHTVLKNII